jgi:hypothetical protein
MYVYVNICMYVLIYSIYFTCICIFTYLDIYMCIHGLFLKDFFSEFCMFVIELDEFMRFT